jgi:hypothetical protein
MRRPSGIAWNCVGDGVPGITGYVGRAMRLGKASSPERNAQRL